MSLKAALLIQEAYNAAIAAQLRKDSLRTLSITEDGLSEYDEWHKITTSFKSSTLYEELHRPETYAQIVALAGVEPDEMLAIGHDPSHLDAAYAVGLSTHRADQPLTKRRLSSALNASMIAPQWLGNIAALNILMAQTKPDHWAMKPAEAEWSGLQVLSHLIESEEQHQRPRLQRIIQEDCPFIAAPMPPGPKQQILDTSASNLLARFKAERQQTLHLTASLSADDWGRPARHSIFGLTTLLEMAHFTAQHDRLHIQQLCQVLGRCND
jgi:hypothetical protein